MSKVHVGNSLNKFGSKWRGKNGEVTAEQNGMKGGYCCCVLFAFKMGETCAYFNPMGKKEGG